MNTELLRAIANATAANSVVYVSQAEGMPLVTHQPALITVDPASQDPSDSTKIAAKITEAGVTYLNSQGAATTTSKPVSSNIEVAVGGFVRPKAKRGGGGHGGAPEKYPFNTMEVNGYFFIADSEVSKGDAFKTLGSAVGGANQRFMEDTGEMHEVKRAVRVDGKVQKDASGKAITETVTVPKKRSTRKFVVSKVESGKSYGSFTAPANGAVVMRSE